MTDLLEIAKARKSPTGRSDARQASLYRAVVASSVGVIEEATEALTVEAVRSTGVATKGMVLLESSIARLMQNPNSSEIQKLMSAFIGFDPIPHLRVKLKTSAPAFRDEQTVGSQTSRQLWTIYNQERTWNAADAAEVLDRFVKIRHSFAHQDSSIVLFTKNEVNALRSRLSAGLAAAPNDRDMVEKLNATCGVRVLHPAPAPSDPVRDWRLHETHAINALLLALCVVSSLADGLADYLDAEVGIARSTYPSLFLNVEIGEWVDLAGPNLSASTNGVSWNHVKYKPGSRT